MSGDAQARTTKVVRACRVWSCSHERVDAEPPLRGAPSSSPERSAQPTNVLPGARHTGFAAEPDPGLAQDDCDRQIYQCVLGDCAMQNGSRCLAVGTSMRPLEELKKAGAHRVVDDLSDPESLLSML